MEYKGIIITGCNASGKSKVAEILNSLDEPGFRLAKTITTHQARNCDIQDEYEYITRDEFANKRENNDFFVDFDYMDEKYGITKVEINNILSTNKIPILVLSPQSYELLREKFDEYMTFFFDNSNEILDDRLQARSNTNNKKNNYAQRKIDRSYITRCLYNVEPDDPNEVANLIKELWNSRNNSGVLNGRFIKLLLKNNCLLKSASLSEVKGASYDLSLGDEYYYKGKIINLSESDPFMEIEPYDYVIASCKEIACIPRNMVGRFDLSVKLFCQGIILSNGPQIDPGFKGKLFCLLFNTSNKTVVLKRGEHYATIEFQTLIEAAPSYEGKYYNKFSILDYIPNNAVFGAINELKNELDDLKKENKMIQNTFLGVMSLILALISFFIVNR